MSQSLEQWLESYKQEKQEFFALSEAGAKKLKQALASSEHLGVPNAFRTAICFELFDHVMKTFGRYEHLTTELTKECLNAVYCTNARRLQDLPFLQAAECFPQGTYFMELQDQLEQRQAIETQILHKQREHSFMMRQLRNKEYMLSKAATRWARTLCLQTFHGWRKVTTQMKTRKANLKKTLRRWKKRLLKQMFLAWQFVVHGNQQRNAEDRLVQVQKQLKETKSLEVQYEMDIRVTKENITQKQTQIEHFRERQAQVNAKLDTFRQLILDSNERQLQQVANKWGNIAIRFGEFQLRHLRQRLDAVKLPEYPNLQLLLEKQEEPMELLQLPIDSLLLRWANVHLRRVKSSKFLQNFSSDIQNGEAMLEILSSITNQDLANAHDAEAEFEQEDYELRAEEIRQHLEHLTPACPKFLTSKDFTSGKSPDLVFAVFCFLFCHHAQLTFDYQHPWAEATKALDEAENIWQNQLKASWFASENAQIPTIARDLVVGSCSIAELNAAQTSLSNAMQMVEYAASRRASSLRLWNCLHRSVQSEGWKVLILRGRGTPYPLIDRKEQREREMYTTLPFDQYAALFRSFGYDGDDQGIVDQLEKLETFLSENYLDLRRIFKHYAASEVGDASSMSMDEFYAFIKDCKLLSKVLTLAHVQQIFALVNDEGDGENDPLNPDYEFTPSEFLEALFHVAERRIKQMQTSMYLGMKKLLSDFILPFACRSNADYFRSQLATKACKHLFDSHREMLQSIYRKYAQASKTLTAEEFQTWVHDYQLCSELFTTEDLATVFTKIQQDDALIVAADRDSLATHAADLANTGALVDVSYAEFCEAIAAIAVYRDSDPYVDLHVKLENLLQTEITSTFLQCDPSFP